MYVIIIIINIILFRNQKFLIERREDVENLMIVALLRLVSRPLCKEEGAVRARDC